MSADMERNSTGTSNFELVSTEVFDKESKYKHNKSAVMLDHTLSLKTNGKCCVFAAAPDSWLWRHIKKKPKYIR